MDTEIISEVPSGLQTLHAIATADRFNRWMFDSISPYCRGSILEIGSGIGNISQFFVAEGRDITLSDCSEGYTQTLKRNFSGVPILDIDLVHPEFDSLYSAHIETFDTVFALNVVEHIQDDLLAVGNAHKLLKPGGRLILLVPRYPRLYNRFDMELGHYRRYTRSTLSALATRAGLQTCTLETFNFAAVFGWWWSGSILRKKTIPEKQMRLFNLLLPMIRLADRLTFKKLGISLILVAEKS